MLIQSTGKIEGAGPQVYRQLGAHLKYLQHGRGSFCSRLREGHLFYAATGLFGWLEARDWLWKAGGSFQKLRLIPGVQEQDRVGHWQAWTREIFADFGEYFSSSLMWVAVQHHHHVLPHVHVVLAGGGNAGGALQLRVDDYHFLLRRSLAHLALAASPSRVAAQRR